MEKETNTTNTATPVAPAPVVGAEPKADSRGGSRDNRRQGGGGGRRPGGGRREVRAKPEFDQKIISLRRVTRVVAGGRRFSFSVSVIAGNRKGMVGVGTGKASDTPLAIEKAFRDARKNMITINTTRDMSIPHDVEAKYSASRVKIMPAKGKGILAGSSVRSVLELAGLKEIGAKLLSRSKNSTNNAYAAIKALESLKHTKIRHPKVESRTPVDQQVEDKKK
jgi:small subunit ribosomal protein S5